ncbi:MAG: glycosyltransferase family 2 protein [Rhodospirillaceae bacterium]
MTMPGMDRHAPSLISVVLPFYNEGPSVDALMTRLLDVLDRQPVPYEIICVDDGSKDHTWLHLSAWRERCEAITLIGLSRNFGKEIAITAGLDAAEGDCTVIMDSDLQHPPEVIGGMLEKWTEGFDVVTGVRKDRTSDGFVRRTLTRLFYRAFNALSQTPITPDAGDFRLLDRKVVDAIRRMRERARFMKGIYGWVGFKNATIPFDVEDRAHGRSSFSPLRLFALAFDGILSFSTAPLRLAMYAGAVIALLALALGTFFIVRTAAFGVDVPGYASIIVSTLGLSGFTLLQIGVMGLYLGRIYDEVKARPLYLVREMVLREGAEAKVDRARAVRQLKDLV